MLTNIFWSVPSIIFALSYFGIANGFAILDKLQPKWYKELEITPRPILTFSLWLKLNLTCFINISIVYFLGLMCWNNIDSIFHLDLSFISIPYFECLSLVLVKVFSLVLCYYWAVIWFWYSHLICHSKYLYKFHKKHHEFKNPIGLCALYCSIFEILIVNAPLGLVMPVLLRLDTFSICIWHVLISSYIILIHCGHYILSADVKFHDDHHRTVNRNYGVLLYS
jgi:sterol desaturase/sphingolipid hydroxylase (fatty acid hydroxylase superfamily)